MPSRYTEQMIERWGLGSGHQRDRAGEQRRLPAPVLRGAGYSRARASSRPPTSPRRPSRKAYRHRVSFFGRETARQLVAQGSQADLLIGNNVLAQVPDLNDFVGGMKIVLRPGGVITMEFPHLMRLIEGNQFDTIYHEHFSYFSIRDDGRIFAAHGLELFDVEELPTHGGSLRIYARHREDSSKPATARVDALLTQERDLGFEQLDRYTTLPPPGRRDQAPTARVPDRRATRRALGGGLRRSGQGQHASKLLRDPDGLPRLHRGPQSV